MNMARFAIVSGLYTEEEVKRSEFVTCLRGAYTKSTIFDYPFATTNLITSVRNPMYRYVLKILSITLVGRNSG
ncbi:hypothetical protein Hanom_Chr03g00195271 [Helianthus anomalus]